MPKSAVSIRPATASDVAFIGTLVPRLASSTYRPSYYTEAEIIGGTLEHLRQAVARSAGDELVVIATGSSGEPVGFLWANSRRDYFTGEPHGYIEEVAVLRDGGGIGSALMHHAETWARERGYAYLSLSVRPHNDRAKAFYARRDFVLDVEVMRKSL